MLSESLETLIMQMTSATEDEDSSLNADEGIVDGHETDSCEDDDKIETISQVIKVGCFCFLISRMAENILKRNR